ncbi:PqqD family protein [Candidatus Fermentibacteria bacterium]|nr:PqqD family protein [Candidatus Fermentibacteria bacterium]
MLDKVVARNKDVAWRVIDGEAILISAEDSMLHSLDEVGTRIWELADGATTVRSIIESICGEFEVEDTQAENDVLEFVTNLSSDKLRLLVLSNNT